MVLLPESSTASMVPWELTGSTQWFVAIGTVVSAMMTPVVVETTSMVPLFFIGITIVLPSSMPVV